MLNKQLLPTWSWVFGDADWPTAPPCDELLTITQFHFAEQWK